MVLKNLADRLIEIGFPELIRAKIFHIYVSFMMKRKVIFVSASNPEAKSRITVGEPKASVAIIITSIPNSPFLFSFKIFMNVCIFLIQEFVRVVWIQEN